MNNFHKAESGAVIFHDYAGARFSRCYDRVPCIIAALLVDLMHFAEAQGIDIEGCVQVGHQHAVVLGSVKDKPLSGRTIARP